MELLWAYKTQPPVSAYTRREDSFPRELEVLGCPQWVQGPGQQAGAWGGAWLSQGVWREC